MQFSEVGLETVGRKRHAIAHQRFREPFRELPQPYKTPSPVTRATFVSYLLQVFIYSRGDLQRQESFMTRHAQETGFDYRRTLHHYLDAGGTTCLNEQERKLILTSYRQVTDHFRRKKLRGDQSTQTDDNILYNFDLNLEV